MAQAAISYQIKMLRGQVGEPLFVNEEARRCVSRGARVASRLATAFDEIKWRSTS